MPQLPKIDEKNRAKPLTMDAQTGRFIMFDEIVDKKGEVPPLDELTHSQLKELVIERQRVGPDYTMRDLNGKMLTRDQIIQEVLHGTKFGNMMMQAEIDYLRELLTQIDSALHPDPT